jgi:hypothetical protein
MKDDPWSGERLCEKAENGVTELSFVGENCYLPPCRVLPIMAGQQR